MTERPNLKQIRIKRSVCDRLDERKDKDDSYTDFVKDLLDENERLKERVEELKDDKDLLMRLFLLNVDNAHEYTFSNSKGQRERLIKEVNDILKDW